jgi:hypothetical protein
MPKILSVNVSFPKEIDFEGQKVTTGIFKEPIEGRVKLRTLNLDGDKQADLTVHGGPDKAVYAYPIEHYEFWRRVYPNMDMPNGMFGENGIYRGKSIFVDFDYDYKSDISVPKIRVGSSVNNQILIVNVDLNHSRKLRKKRFSS